MVGGDAGRLRAIRLATLAADAGSFGSSLARERELPEDWWAGWASASEDGAEQRTFVAVDGEGRWVGIALARRDEEAPDGAVLNAMWVAPQARGQGVAGSLCDACARWAAARGLRRLALSAVAGNASALRAYAAAGFVRVGVRERTVGDGRRLDEVLLAREL